MTIDPSYLFWFHFHSWKKISKQFYKPQKRFQTSWKIPYYNKIKQEKLLETFYNDIDSQSKSDSEYMHTTSSRERQHVYFLKLTQF